jgi:Fic/DOC family
MFEEVDERRRRLDAYRPFTPEMRARLDAVFEPWFIYGSNALEGNTLSLGDTIYLIREGRLPSGKTEEEYLEVKGQQAAYSYLRQAVEGRFRPSEKLVRELHQLLTGGLDSEKYRPGQYKDRDNQVRLSDGSLFPYVSHVNTPSAMQALIDWWLGDAGKLHPVEQASRLHYNFILIHPFRDGNGRTARLLTNLLLLQAGHGMVVFRAAERRRVYLEALRAVDRSVDLAQLAPDNPALNLFPFMSFLEQELLWSYDLALDVLEGRVATSTEDLIGRFGGMEQRALAAAGITPDEATRLKETARQVQSLTRRIGTTIAAISSGLDSKWQDLETFHSIEDEPPKAMDSSALFGRKRREVLGIGNAPFHGAVGIVSLEISNKETSAVRISVPTNTCEFVVFAEPHALVIGAIRQIETENPGLRTSSDLIRFPLGSEPQNGERVDGFVLEQVRRFLDQTEAEITARNDRGPS